MSSSEKRYRRAVSRGEIAPGTGKLVEIDDERIAVFNFGGVFFATGDMCPHRGASLAEGFLDRGKVFCPWHCFDFNLKTGECETVPSLHIQTYEVKVEGDEVFVLC